ncbi:MAG: hypothetical protein GY788_02830 [bacterium]|nr:hypothetical protein [bacterium]
MGRARLFRLVAWAVAAFALVVGFLIALDDDLSFRSRLLATILTQSGGAVFFALTVGWAMKRVQDYEGYSVLWLFSQEFRKAGLTDFYSSRTAEAQKALEEAFEHHQGGEILMVGASLRLFLAPGLHFYKFVGDVLNRDGSSPIAIRAVSCDPDKNRELPFRSLAEEFLHESGDDNLDYDRRNPRKLDLEEFCQEFADRFGLNGRERELRVVHDLRSTRVGVTELRKAIPVDGNTLEFREQPGAPYATIIIFPDRAFFTPNLLSATVPANMPTLVYHRSSEPYRRLREHFDILWWLSSDPTDHAGAERQAAGHDTTGHTGDDR